jgi:hypothetical protein
VVCVGIHPRRESRPRIEDLLLQRVSLRQLFGGL